MSEFNTVQDSRPKRVGQVFKFLQALHQLRNPVQKQVEDHAWTFWLHDLPDHADVQKGTWAQDLQQANDAHNGLPAAQEETFASASDDFVFKIKRPILSECPIPPYSVLTWLVAGWKEPERAAETISEREEKNTEGDVVSVRLDESDQRVAEFQNWQKAREAWAQPEVTARKAQRLFERLYALHGQMQREAEAADLVVGDGMLRWKRADGDVYYPLLIQRLQLEFRPAVPEFIARETEDAAQFNAALFRAMPDVDGQRIGGLGSEQEAENYAPLEGRRVSEFLRRMAAQLAARGEFVGANLPPTAQEFPQIGRDPVIFVRSRSQGFANALDNIRQQLAEYESKEQTEEVKVLSSSLLNIVGMPEHEAVSDTPNVTSMLGGAQQDDTILFSKPANEEQLQIAQRLEQNGCVLVQGPPGTGKTHTIGNLLGHLLSQGKTVLVTSHTEKALRVVREQVVPALRPLCVSVLGSDGDSNKQLEGSVQAIVARQGDVGTSEAQAARLAKRRSNVLAALRAAQQRLLEARTDEYREVVIAGQGYAPSNAARKVAAGQGQNDWLPAPVETGTSLPLSSGELAELYATNVSVTAEDEQELAVNLPAPDALLSPVDFAQVVAEREELKHENLVLGAEWWNSAASPTACRSLQSVLPLLATALRALQTEDAWRLAVAAAGMEGPTRSKVWEELLALINSLYQQAAKAEEMLVRHGPNLAQGIALPEQRRIADEICAHLEKGGKLNTVTFLLHRAWPPFVQGARVGSESPHSLEHFRALRTLIELQATRQELTERWERLFAPLNGPAVADLGAEPERACKQLAPSIQNGLKWHDVQWLPLRQELETQGLRWTAFFENVPANFAKHGELLRLRDAILALENGLVAAQCHRLQWSLCEQQIGALESSLSHANTNGAAPIIERLREATRQLDANAYRAAWERLAELHHRHSGLQQRRALLRRLEPSAPMWASAIRERLAPHDGSTLPGNAEDAWLWRQLHDELQRRAGVSLKTLQQEIERLNSDLQQVTAELIECRAWNAQGRRTNFEMRQTLNGWLAVTKKVGGGKGKRVPRLLAEARKLLRASGDAVPVWIMSLARVADNFDARTKRFDVLIIDEASQCDLMGLIALYMAKTVIVVGDDEQVSPDAVAERVDEVQHLIDEHLEGVPNHVLYDGQTSIYDLAKTSFGANICLTEHFRCAPEIVQFSSHLSYDDKIKPLRDVSGVSTTPHVIAYRVQGVCTRRNTNLEEAQAIASLLIAATEQTEYAESTFGVISLVGDEQAAVIDKLLQSRMSTTEYSKRRVVCGNPAQFQGDERDVMFLSVVDDPKEGPLTLRRDGPRKMWKKRYNVAASRARNQMWVVHSLQTDKDLKSDDIRLQLIRHAENPQALMQILEDVSRRAESEFERQVIERLVTAGYRVTPQWKVGAYRIDMVVEGGGKQLAIECDGDRYHPPDKMPEDMARQALLERLGWTFERIRGSVFFRNPQAAMQPVFERLQRMGITLEALSTVEESTRLPSELQTRVIRRAEELRRQWASESDSNKGTSEEPVTIQPGTALSSTPLIVLGEAVTVDLPTALSAWNAEAENVENEEISVRKL